MQYAFGSKPTISKFTCEPMRYPLGASICEALAMLDSGEAHSALAEICNQPGNIHLRSSAIVATGYECDWHDEVDSALSAT